MRQRECNMKYQKSMCIKEGTVLASHQLYLLFFFFLCRDGVPKSCISV